MEELIARLEKIKKQKERFFQMMDNNELDIVQIDDTFKRLENEVADLRNEFEVEDFLLCGAKGIEPKQQ